MADAEADELYEECDMYFKSAREKNLPLCATDIVGIKDRVIRKGIYYSVFWNTKKDFRDEVYKEKYKLLFVSSLILSCYEARDRLNNDEYKDSSKFWKTILEILGNANLIRSLNSQIYPAIKEIFDKYKLPLFKTEAAEMTSYMISIEYQALAPAFSFNNLASTVISIYDSAIHLADSNDIAGLYLHYLRNDLSPDQLSIKHRQFTLSKSTRNLISLEEMEQDAKSIIRYFDKFLRVNPNGSYPKTLKFIYDEALKNFSGTCRTISRNTNSPSYKDFFDFDLKPKILVDSKSLFFEIPSLLIGFPAYEWGVAANGRVLVSGSFSEQEPRYEITRHEKFTIDRNDVTQEGKLAIYLFANPAVKEFPGSKCFIREFYFDKPYFLFKRGNEGKYNYIDSINNANYGIGDFLIKSFTPFSGSLPGSDGLHEMEFNVGQGKEKIVTIGSDVLFFYDDRCANIIVEGGHKVPNLFVAHNKGGEYKEEPVYSTLPTFTIAIPPQDIDTYEVLTDQDFSNTEGEKDPISIYGDKYLSKRNNVFVYEPNPEEKHSFKFVNLFKTLEYKAYAQKSLYLFYEPDAIEYDCDSIFPDAKRRIKPFIDRDYEEIPLNNDHIEIPVGNHIFIAYVPTFYWSFLSGDDVNTISGSIWHKDLITGNSGGGRIKVGINHIVDSIDINDITFFIDDVQMAPIPGQGSKDFNCFAIKDSILCSKNKDTLDVKVSYKGIEEKLFTIINRIHFDSDVGQASIQFEYDPHNKSTKVITNMLDHLVAPSNVELSMNIKGEGKNLTPSTKFTKGTNEYSIGNIKLSPGEYEVTFEDKYDNFKSGPTKVLYGYCEELKPIIGKELKLSYPKRADVDLNNYVFKNIQFLYEYEGGTTEEDEPGNVCKAKVEQKKGKHSNTGPMDIIMKFKSTSYAFLYYKDDGKGGYPIKYDAKQKRFLSFKEAQMYDLENKDEQGIDALTHGGKVKIVR